MNRLNRLRKAGMQVVMRTGMFDVPAGGQGWPLVRAIDEAVKQFAEGMMKRGWTIETKPEVHKMRQWEDTYKAVPDQKGDVLLIPQSTAMRSDHPWWKPDKDQYEVKAWVSKPPVTYIIDLSDKVIKRGLPKGTKLIE